MLAFDIFKIILCKVGDIAAKLYKVAPSKLRYTARIGKTGRLGRLCVLLTNGIRYRTRLQEPSSREKQDSCKQNDRKEANNPCADSFASVVFFFPLSLIARSCLSPLYFP